MAQDPYGLSTDDGEGDPSRRRIPRPEDLVAGTPGDPAGMQSHGTQGWDAYGQPQGGFHDYLADVRPPSDLPDISTRPRTTVPQVGRPGSILGAITGGVGGVQALKQQDWDTKYGARLGAYQRQVELAKQRNLNQYHQGMATRPYGQRGAPLVTMDDEGNPTGSLADEPDHPAAGSCPGSNPDGTGQRRHPGREPGKHRGRQEPDRANASGHEGHQAQALQGQRGQTAITVAQIHSQAVKTGKPQYFVIGGKLAQVNPDSTVNFIEGSEGATKPPSGAQRPDTVTQDTYTRDNMGNVTGKISKKKNVVPPPPAPKKNYVRTGTKPDGTRVGQLADGTVEVLK